MIDLPPVLPDEYPAPPALVQTCADRAARYFGLPPLVVRAIAEAEGGKVGTVSKNRNGTYDLGVMQINSIHLPEIQKRFNIGWRELTYKPCVNIGVGTWFLAKKVQQAPDFWTGVGNYHSATAKHHQRYVKRVTTIYRRLLDQELKRAAERQAQAAREAQQSPTSKPDVGAPTVAARNSPSTK